MGMLKLGSSGPLIDSGENLEEAEKFYGEILGLECAGRLATSRSSCFTFGGHNILLCEMRKSPPSESAGWGRLHHAFDASPEMFIQLVKSFEISA